MKIQITLDIEPAEIPLANEIIATLRYEAIAHHLYVVSAALCMMRKEEQGETNAHACSCFAVERIFKCNC
jgi:hypothetical protein